MSGELAISGRRELGPVDEARYEAALADAKVDVARRAQVADEELVPLLRERADRWREWGASLGAPESKSESGRKGGSRDTESQLDDAERKRRQRARTIADIEDGKYRAWRDGGESPEELTWTALLKAAHVSQATGHNEWYTPPEFIEAACAVMGAIDLDPASTPEANEVVGAGTFYGIEDDGLTKEWTGRVWMNPPYARPLVDEFCAKLAEHYAQGDVSEGCVLVNNATETSWFQTLSDVMAAVFFPSKRVRFWQPDKEKGAPLQGQAVIYLGANVESFRQEFSTRISGWSAAL